MPLTVNRTGDWHNIVGNLRRARVTIDFDASYPTGGESFTPADVGMRVFDFVFIQPRSGFVFDFNYTSNLVLAYSQGFITGATAAADATAGTLVTGDASTEGTFRAMGVAVSTTVKLGEMLEVASTTDLSALTGVRVIALGT